MQLKTLFILSSMTLLILSNSQSTTTTTTSTNVNQSGLSGLIDFFKTNFPSDCSCLLLAISNLDATMQQALAANFQSNTDTTRCFNPAGIEALKNAFLNQVQAGNSVNTSAFNKKNIALSSCKTLTNDFSSTTATDVANPASTISDSALQMVTSAQSIAQGLKTTNQVSFRSLRLILTTKAELTKLIAADGYCYPLRSKEEALELIQSAISTASAVDSNNAILAQGISKCVNQIAYTDKCKSAKNTNISTVPASTTNTQTVNNTIVSSGTNVLRFLQSGQPQQQQGQPQQQQGQSQQGQPQQQQGQPQQQQGQSQSQQQQRPPQQQQGQSQSQQQGQSQSQQQGQSLSQQQGQSQSQQQQRPPQQQQGQSQSQQQGQSQSQQQGQSLSQQQGQSQSQQQGQSQQGPPPQQQGQSQNKQSVVISKLNSVPICNAQIPQFAINNSINATQLINNFGLNGNQNNIPGQGQSKNQQGPPQQGQSQSQQQSQKQSQQQSQQGPPQQQSQPQNQQQQGQQAQQSNTSAQKIPGNGRLLQNSQQSSQFQQGQQSSGNGCQYFQVNSKGNSVPSVPQTNVDQLKSTISNYQNTFNSSIGAIFSSNMSDPEKCAFQQFPFDHLFDANKQKPKCTSGSTYSLTCSKTTSSSGDSTTCVCDKGTCPEYAGTHNSTQVINFLKNIQGFYVVFICDSSTGNNPYILMMITVTNSNICFADFKGGKMQQGLGQAAGVAADACSRVGFGAMLTKQVTAAAKASGATSSDITNMASQCIPPMDDFCTQRIANVFQANNIDNLAASTNFSDMFSSCKDLTINSDQNTLIACAQLASATVLKPGGLAPVDISTFTNNANSIQASVSSGGRLLQTTTSVSASTYFRPSTVDNISALVDPSSLNLSSAINVGGSTPDSLASTSTYISTTNEQAATLSKSSSSMIKVVMSMMFIALLVIFA